MIPKTKEESRVLWMEVTLQFLLTHDTKEVNIKNLDKVIEELKNDPEQQAFAIEVKDRYLKSAN